LDKKGVSEVVGALLTLVVIVTAAGLIYTDSVNEKSLLYNNTKSYP